MGCTATLHRFAYRGCCSDVELNPGEVVVHIGSSTGEETLRLAEKVGKQGKVFGVCSDPGRVRMAINRQWGFQVRNAEFLDARGNSIPLPDGSVNVVMVDMGVLNDQSRGQVLAEIHRLLTPGGRFMLCDVVNRDGNPLQECPLPCRCSEPPTTEGAYRRQLRQHGFSDLRMARRQVFDCAQGHRVMEVSWRGCKAAG